MPGTCATPAALKAAVDALQLKPISKHAKKYGQSFVHDAALAISGLWSAEACQPLTDLLNQLNQMRSAPPAWMSEWRPLCMHMHNYLNDANVLVDLQVREQSDCRMRGLTHVNTGAHLHLPHEVHKLSHCALV